MISEGVTVSGLMPLLVAVVTDTQVLLEGSDTVVDLENGGSMNSLLLRGVSVC